LRVTVQILIAVLGIAAVWLSQDERYNRRKYACIFGLIGQPLWLYTTWKAEQWGIFFLSIVYTFAWAKGFYLYWMEKKSRHE
jgi:nicotinamide riboside transporter PnuC